MKIKLPLAIYRFVMLSSLLVGLTACAGASGGGSVQSSGTPVNPRTNPGGADTATAALTGAQPRGY